MARYKTLAVVDTHHYMLMSPAGPLEALKLAWYSWRYPERCSALVIIDEKWMKANTVAIAEQPESILAAQAMRGVDGVVRPAQTGPLFGPTGGMTLPRGMAL